MAYCLPRRGGKKLKRRRIVIILALLALTAGAAYGAWVTYQASMTGSASGTIATSDGTAPALVVSTNGAGVAGAPSSKTGGAVNGTVPLKVTNLDTTTTYSVSGVTVSFAVTGHPECSAHLSHATDPLPTNIPSISSATPFTSSVSYALDATTPVSCAGGTVVATLGGTVSSP